MRRKSNRTLFSASITRSSSSTRRNWTVGLLECLEERQVLSTMFVGVTAPTGSPQVQNLVTFNSTNPTNFTTVGALTGVTSGYLLESLSRDPFSNTTYGFAVNSSGSGQVYRINTMTAVATALGSPNNGNFAQGPNAFYANGNEFAYSGSTVFRFDPQGTLVSSGSISGNLPVAQATIIDSSSSNPATYGLAAGYETYTSNGQMFSSGPNPSQSFASNVGLQVAGGTSSALQEYLTGLITVNSTTEYDLFQMQISSGNVTKLATLPQTLYGFADSVFMPTLHVSGISGNVTAGSTQSITVTADPGDGSTDTGYTGTVHFTSSDGQAILPANAMLTNGTGTFNVTFKTAGTQSITATDTVNTADTGSENGINVVPGATRQYIVTGATNETAGGVETVTVKSEDAYGNVTTGYTGTVHITSSDAQATLPADATLTNGTGTFNVTLKTAGTQSIIATDTTTASINGSQVGIVVTAAAFNQLVLMLPMTGTAGTAETLSITAADAYGNVVTTNNDTINLSTSDAQAVLPASVDLASGTASVMFTPKTSGTQSVTATDATTTSITRTAATTVTAAAAVKFVVAGAPGGTAGSAESFTVTAKDIYGNTATGYTGTVHFTSSDSTATLPADATLTNGTGTFSATLKKAGSDSITATDTTTASITGTEANIAVTPAAAAILNVTGPATSVSGAAEIYMIAAADAYGNAATGDNNTVNLTTSDSAAQIPASVTLANGTASFSATLKTNGTQTVTATDSTTASVTGSTSTTVQAKISGVVFLDSNANGIQDSGEKGLAGRVVFLDTNGSGTLNPSDPTATTDANGNFAFQGVAAGLYKVYEALSLDTSNRYVVSQTKTNTDQSLSIGVVPFSALAPVPVLPNPFTNNPGTTVTERYIQSLYRTVLARTGSAGEVAGWVAQFNKGASSGQVAMGFINSAEHRTDEVYTYYSSILHRAPDPSSTHWVNLLESGVSEQKVIQAFINSNEYQSAHSDSSTYIRDLYLDVLGRQGSDAEVTSFQTKMTAGTSRQAVAASFVESAEAYDQVVDSLYTASLRRQREMGSSNYWTTKLSQGVSVGNVAVGILSSDEFISDAEHSTSN